MSIEKKTVETKDMATCTLRDKGQANFTSNMLIYPAVILHPSLGCPLIVEEQGPVSLFIVTDKTFRQAFLDDNGGQCNEYATGGLRVATSIRQHLKLVVWEQARELKQNLSQNDQPLKVAEKDIVCTYLGKLDREIKNADGKHIANIRQSVLNQLYAFREKDTQRGTVGKFIDKYFTNDGLRYLFQIDLHNLKLAPNELYDSYWVLKNHNPHKVDIQPKYLDIQDRITREYIQENYYRYAGKAGPEYTFKVTESGVKLIPDTDTPIMNHHPIWLAPAGKDKLNIGHLSDVHVSSKQAAYKGKGATVIPGAEASIAPPIGNMANNNADNFFDLLSQFGNDANTDLVVITGDLYDHLHNFDAAKLKENRTGKLWEAMYADEEATIEARNEEFPCGIDGLSVYSILIHFYSQHKKPIFIVSGNHEAYEYPYGISPRVGSTRANEGIPMDHNLTIYEAILLYGPAYKLLIPSAVSGTGATFSGGLLGRMNFKKQNFNWFYTLFTPLTDYWQSYKEQTLISLGWGDGEEYMWNPTPVPGLDEGGHLPRASVSIDDKQKSLVETALQQNGRDKILCSHFTVVNYALDVPLTTEGEVKADDEGYSKFEYGTVKSDRSTFHGDWIGKDRFSMTLSGHSHRVGLYRCKYTPPKFDVITKKLAPGYLQTKGYHPEDSSTPKVAWGNKTKVLVSASTGPLSKQNRKGEMVGWGMEHPSGSRIRFDGGESITLVKCVNKNAKPRFCVACDYIDLLDDGFWEYFKAVDSNGTFEMKPHWEKIYPKLGEQAKRTLIESVTLWIVEKGKLHDYRDTPKPKANNLVITFPSSLAKKLISRRKFIDAIFLSIKFNGKPIQHLPGFKDYNYESPWNIQVGIYSADGVDISSERINAIKYNKSNAMESRRQVAAKRRRKLAANTPNSWQIMRHKEKGEVPDFEWRMVNWPGEFMNNFVKKKSK